MVLKRNTAEGQPNSTTLTAANSGGGSGDAFAQVALTGSPAITYSTDQAMHGTRSYEVTVADGSSMTLVMSGAVTSSGAMQAYIYFTAYPATPLTFIQAHKSTGNFAGSFVLLANGRIVVTDTTNTTLITAPTAIPLNTWIRFDLVIIPGATATTGRIMGAYYVGDSTTATWSYDSGTTINAGIDQLDNFRFGKLAATGTMPTFYIDDVAIDPGKTSYIPIGATTNQTPSSHAGASVANIEPYSTQTLTGTDNDTDGTIVTRTWRQVSGSPAVSLSGSGATRTYTTPGTLNGTSLVFGYTVTDNDGDTSPEATVTHAILPVTERVVAGGVEVPARSRALKNGSLVSDLSYAVSGGVLVRRGGAGGGSIRPTGPGYVRYEDVYVTGDDLQDVVNRVTGNRVLTFPEGEFLIPNNFANGYRDGVRMAGSGGGAGCRGFVGSGRNTVFKMLSSNRTAWVSGASPYMLIDATASSEEPFSTVEFRNFRIEGTDLGHEYHGLRLQRCKGIIDNVYITGVTGFDKVPPGETGSINLFECDNVIIKNVEVDGRRNGVRVASSPIMPNNSTNITVEDCYVHHTYTGGGGIAWFHCTDAVVTRVRSEYIGSGPGKQAGACFNHEQTTQITYWDPVMICDRNAVGGGLHMTLNADGERGGTDCIMTVHNPTWDPTSVGGGQFVVQTWTLPQQNQRTPPTVLDANGNPLPFTYLNPYL
jgi:hypothetical protein